MIYNFTGNCLDSPVWVHKGYDSVPGHTQYKFDREKRDIIEQSSFYKLSFSKLEVRRLISVDKLFTIWPLE